MEPLGASVFQPPVGAHSGSEAGSEDEEQEPLYSSDEGQQDAEQQLFHRRRCAAADAFGGACGRLCSASDAVPDACCRKCSETAFVCAVCAEGTPPGAAPQLALMTFMHNRGAQVCHSCWELEDYRCSVPGCNVAMTFYYWDDYRPRCSGCSSIMCHLCCADAWVREDSEVGLDATRLCASCAVRMAVKEPARLTTCTVCAKRLYRYDEADHKRSRMARCGFYKQELHSGDARERPEQRPTSATVVVDTSAAAGLPSVCCFDCQPEHAHRMAVAARAAEQRAAVAAERARDDAHLELPPGMARTRPAENATRYNGPGER